MLKLTFANKLILSIVGIEIIFITLRVYLGFSTLHKLSDELINEKVQTSTHFLSTVIAAPMVLNDLSSLDDHVHEFLSAENITSIKVVDKEHRTVSNISKAKEINFDIYLRNHYNQSLQNMTPAVLIILL